MGPGIVLDVRGSHIERGEHASHELLRRPWCPGSISAAAPPAVFPGGFIGTSFIHNCPMTHPIMSQDTKILIKKKIDKTLNPTAPSPTPMHRPEKKLQAVQRPPAEWGVDLSQL